MGSKKSAPKSSKLVENPAFSSDRLPALVGSLLKWFRQEARVLPWRETQDPYAIWVSEIMLQQTQVKTVIPYWERWMKRFPTVSALAQAPIDQVLKFWEGLGYYRRARHLHAAAVQLTEAQAGRFPSTLEAVLDLPGIGRYTAGAICSIAFNQPVALLDGNVIRVLTRLGAIAGDPRDPAVNDSLWKLAQRFVESASALPPHHVPALSGNCSALNQSLMELGATVCTPRAPGCDRCPVSRFCSARRLGTMEDFPRLQQKPKPTRRFFQAFVVERAGAVMVQRRPEGEVNAGLWEFPNIEVESAALSDPERTLQEFFHFRGSPLELLAEVTHSITRYRMRLQAHRAALAAGARFGLRNRADETSSKSPQHPPVARWVTAEEATALAFASAHRKLLTAWLERRLAVVGKSGSTRSYESHTR